MPGQIRRRLCGLIDRRGLGDFACDRHMPRQEDAEDRSLADQGIHEHVAVGLLDDAVDGREAKSGALAGFLGGEEWLKDLVDDLARNAAARVLYLDRHVIG